MGSHSSASPLAHALVIPFPAQGHINPLMQFAKRLSAKGVATTVVTLEYYVKLFESGQRDYRESGADDGKEPGLLRLVGLQDGLPEGNKRRAMSADIASAVENLEGEVAKLLQDYQRPNAKELGDDSYPPVTCVIGDLFISWVPRLAQEFDLPEVVFWPQTASTFSVYAHLDDLISTGYNPWKGNSRPFGPKPAMELVDCIPGLPSIHPSDLPFETVFGDLGLQFIETLMNNRFSQIHQALAVVINSCEELEPEVCKGLGPKLHLGGPRIHMVGPCVPSSLLTTLNQNGAGEKINTDVSYGTSLMEEEDCTEWLDAQPPLSVLYVSFGSTMKHKAEQIKELALGLAASKQRFLWVIREDAIETEGEGAQKLQVQELLDGIGFAEEVKERGKVVGWASQAQVLMHGCIGGFFSHCGWNSVAEGLCAGVPILGWPYMMDQLTNCWLICERWKAGLRLPVDERNEAPREDIERAVRFILDHGEDLRASARDLQDAARRAHARGSISLFATDLLQLVITSP